MKVKELLKVLDGVDPETELIGGAWNGRVDTYEVLDHTHHIHYDELWGDFYGTPGEMDDRLFKIDSKMVLYIGSYFTMVNRKASADRHFIWRLREVVENEGSDETKGEELLQMIKEFVAEDYKVSN